MRHLLAGMFVLGALTWACGGGTDPAGTEEDLREAARKSSEAALSGNLRDAYASYTDRCKALLTYGTYAEKAFVGLAFFKGIYDVEPKDAAVREVQIQDFTPTGANVHAVIVVRDDPSLVLESPPVTFRPWRFEGGEWRSDDCDRFVDTATPTPG